MGCSVRDEWRLSYLDGNLIPIKLIIGQSKKASKNLGWNALPVAYQNENSALFTELFNYELVPRGELFFKSNTFQERTDFSYGEPNVCLRY